MTRLAVATVLFMSACSSTPLLEDHPVQIPTSAQVTTDIAGKAATAVKQGVLRVICRSTSSGGTGFLHSSGGVLTAAHVVKDCKAQDLVLVTPGGKDFGVAAIDADDALDLALLRPGSAIPGQPLSIGPVAPPAIGMQVATWGYPGGYSGLAPLLSVGYLAGTQEFKEGGATIQRWVINAAFNGGNSGGPVLSLEDGSIVGVVSSKLAPVPKEIATILELLSKQQSGLTYEGTKADGSKVTFTEGQLIGEVLQYLRSQVQLVIGYAVSPEDIAKFLKARNIKP
ncbi:MAG TPA: serine protease [Methylomirabilota bacterium]|nr:serine protease [Methylomirabilota bacterium]